MPIQIPIDQWPYQMNSQGTGFGLVEQDSSVEVAQCVAFLYSTDPGTIIDEPSLGLSDPTFRLGGVDEAALEGVVQRWEPRALVHFEKDELVALAQTVNVGVESTS